MFTNWAHPDDQRLGQETAPPEHFDSLLHAPFQPLPVPRAAAALTAKPGLVLPDFVLYVNTTAVHALLACVWLLLRRLLFVNFIPTIVCGCRLLILVAAQ